MSMDDETHGPKAGLCTSEPINKWTWLVFSKYCREPISRWRSDAAVNIVALRHLGTPTPRQHKFLHDVSIALAGKADIMASSGNTPIFLGQYQETTLDLAV